MVTDLYLRVIPLCNNHFSQPSNIICFSRVEKSTALIKQCLITRVFHFQLFKKNYIVDCIYVEILNIFLVLSSLISQSFVSEALSLSCGVLEQTFLQKTSKVINIQIKETLNLKKVFFKKHH